VVFSSLLFVLAFLPLCYAVYAIVPGIKAKNIILLAFSLIFYAWGGPALVLLLAGMTLVCYVGACLIDDVRRHRRLWLTLTLVICLGLLAVFKYTGFFLSNVKTLLGLSFAVPSITLPIGISFYTFQLLSYVIDVYRGEVPVQRKYWMLLLYASLFHQCIAGPIIRYSDVNEELEKRTVTREGMARGITRFATGLAKKALLANGCAAIVSELVEKPTNLGTVSGAAILLAAVAYMLEIYLDFSAYSDMAIGMGEMIGFHYLENFRYPYAAHSITEFWRRWHISLSSFFRDYVYIPLGGNRVSLPRQIFNLFAVWALTGLWHGASWNFVLWGLYYFVFLVIEKFLIRMKKQPTGLWRIPRTVYTLVVVLFGWMLFYYTDLSRLGVAVKGIFTLNGNRFWDMAAQTQLMGNLFFLVVACVACTPIIPAIGQWFEGRRESLTTKPNGLAAVAVTVYDAVCALLPVALVCLSVLALVGDSYNPFLYFQF
jgi:alginate O-acetyltransferase complex protein AlgI